MIHHTGNRPYRIKQNPLEGVFAKYWQKDNELENGAGVLAYSMGDGRYPAAIDQKQATLAASVVQWLGSPVGQRFLIDVLSSPEAEDFRRNLQAELKQQ